MNLSLDQVELSEFQELAALSSFTTSEDRFFSAIPYLQYLAEYTGQKFYVLFAKNDGVLAGAICFSLSAQAMDEELNCGGSPIFLYFPNDLLGKTAKKIATPLFEKLLEVAKQNGKKTIQFGGCPILKELCFGREYSIRSYMNGQTNLEQLPADSLSWLRKSYRSLMSWGKKNLELKMISQAEPSEELFEEVRQFHIQVTGRETRAKSSWDAQYAAIINSDDFVNLAYLEGRLVSANLIMTSHTQAFYGVGINDRELMAENVPIGHYPILQAMLHAKALGKKVFDFGKLGPAYADDKEKTIATFKKGFCQQLEFKNQIILAI